jgi:hypothetical protein
MDLVGVDKLYHTLSFRVDLDPGITGGLGFQTRTDDRHLRADQGHSLTLHVRSHQGTVGVIMLKEGDQRSTQPYDLVGRYVHVFYFSLVQDREITRLAGNNLFFDEIPFIIQSDIRLGDLGDIFFFSAQVGKPLQIDLAIRYLPVRRFDKAHFVDLRMYAQRGDQTDIRTFRRLDGTETAVVGIMHVTNFEAGALTAQTAWSQRGDTTLVRDLAERVGLIEELRQLGSTEKRINNRAQSPGIDQIHRSEYFIVTDIHPLADGAGHTGQTYPELSIQLLAYRTDTTVAEVIDIIDFGLGIGQPDQVLDDLDHIFLRQRLLIQGLIQVELTIDLVTPDFTQVITLVAEE